MRHQPLQLLRGISSIAAVHAIAYRVALGGDTETPSGTLAVGAFMINPYWPYTAFAF